MAYTFDRTTTHKYPQVTGPNWYATNFFTISLWFRLADVTNNHVLLRLNHATGTGANNFYLRARGDQAGDYLEWVSQVNGVDYTVTTATGYSADTWHNVLVRANRTGGSIAIGLDGGAAAVTTSVKFPTTALGYFQISGADAFTPAAIGSIAEVGLWDATVADGTLGSLTGAAQLAKGFIPWLAQPKNLIGYWPLGGWISGLQDIRGAQTLTAYNSPVKGEHPRILR